MSYLDLEFLKLIAETPSVGTACGPVVNELTVRFGDHYQRTLVSDGFCLFQKLGASPEQLKAVFVAHIDEIGGCVYGQRPEQGFNCRFWGTNDPKLYVNADLQAFDYLAEDSSSAFPVHAEIVESGGEVRLGIFGDKIRPYRTVFTFRNESRTDNQYLYAKAVDPRATVYAVAEAVRRLNNPAVGALFVMAEECAMDVARKAVTFLSRNAPNLQLIVNADVPSLQNLGEADLDLPAIRVFEGHNFIDPSFGIRVSDKLLSDGILMHLSAAKSGSQTLLFAPLAPTLSVALPGENIHSSNGKVSLVGISRCVDLLSEIGERQLAGNLS